MAVTREATVFGIQGEGDALNLALVIDRDTPGEQRVSFGIPTSDYEALGSPGYGDTITVTLEAA